MATPYLEQRLDEHLGYATHVQIVCGRPGIGPDRCGHSTNMTTRALVELCPGAVTIGDFTRRLRCKACGGKGWATIRGLGR